VRATRVAHALNFIRSETAKALKPNAGAGFRAFAVFGMAVQSKGRMDVQTSIDMRKIALLRVLSAPLSAAMPERELAVFHQKIVDTRFRQ
jgi:hypothetical protein